MSDGSNTSVKILTEPLKSIGAQDLLKVGYGYYGTLRKQGTLERLIGSSMKWRQKFVVLAQGCVYCFKDEYSDKPVSAFSLSIYESVAEVTSANVPHCFEIKHTIPSKSPQVFACESEERRKIWVDNIHDALEQAHLQSGYKSSADSDEGIADVSRRRPARKSTAPLPPLPPIPSSPAESDKKKKYKQAASEYDLEESDDEQVYDDIKETEESPKSPKSPMSPTAKKNMPGAVSVMPGMGQMHISKLARVTSISNRPAVPIPTKKVGPKVEPKPNTTNSATLSDDDNSDEKTKPDYINDVFPYDEYYLDSDDKIKAKGYLQAKPEGTFLVRKSKSTAGHVLSIQTNTGVREFVIKEEGSKVSLGLGDWFPSIDALLCYYNQNKIPKSDYIVKLTKGYKS